MMMATAVSENACCRFSGGKWSRMMACCVGCSPPPKNPCNERNTRSCQNSVASPQASDMTVNAPTQIRKYRLRPSNRPSAPEIVSTMPLATR
jgi:hypothetical protein